MSWVLIAGAGWLGVGIVLALIVGHSIRLADAKASGEKAAAAMAGHPEPNFVVDPPVIDLGPATVPSFDALVSDLPTPHEVPPATAPRPRVLGGGIAESERARPREHGLA